MKPCSRFHEPLSSRHCMWKTESCVHFHGRHGSVFHFDDGFYYGVRPWLLSCNRSPFIQTVTGEVHCYHPDAATVFSESLSREKRGRVPCSVMRHPHGHGTAERISVSEATGCCWCSDGRNMYGLMSENGHKRYSESGYRPAPLGDRKLMA